VHSATVETVLNECFKNQPLSYTLIDKIVVVKEKKRIDPINPVAVLAAPVSIIRGTVKDDKGNPLAGVSVVVKGTAKGTSTAADGSFSIDAKERDMLEFSMIGYQKRGVRVGKNQNINVVMEIEAAVGNEVVVVGYGTQRKKDLTGSVASVPVEDMLKAPVKSFDEALAGRVAGVQVNSNDGQPGSGFNITIRGQNSLTQDNSPLYVVDGFPIEGANNNAINPADIESIEVLKDASASAIYGARGANGVILITTRSGKKGKPTIDYSGNYGFQQNIKTMDLMDPYEFVRLQSELNLPIAKSLYLDSVGRTLDSYKTIKSIDWQDQLFRNGPIQQHNISLGGASDNTQYIISGSINNQEGLIINSGFKRYQGRMSVTQKVTDRLKVYANFNYSNIQANGVVPTSGTNSATNNLLYSTWGYRPVAGSGNNLAGVLFDPDIDGSNDYRVNPIISSNNELRNAATNNFIANSYAEYKINKSLTFKVSGGITNNLRRNDLFYNSLTYYGNPSSAGGVNGVNGSVIFTQTTSWLNENTLTYKTKFNNYHNLNILAGVTFQGDRFSRYGSAAIQVPNESLGLNGLDEGVPQRIDAQSSDSKLESFISRVNYNYKSKYLATLSFRADGSSKFSPGKRWSYFPSGSFAWRMSSEDFMEKLEFVSDAKLRIGYGITGNNRVGDFSYLSVLGMPAGSPYAFNNSINLGAIPISLGNPDLKWESTSQANIGYDLIFFNYKLSITADIYRKTTYDLLLNADLPYTTGYDNAFKNIGKVRNQGLEFSVVNTNISNKNFKWTSSLNISFNQSKVLELNQNQESMTSSLGWDNSFSSTPLYIAKLNQPIAQFYGYVFNGIYQLEDFDVASNGAYTLKGTISDNGNVRSSIQPGDIRYKDLNGDGVVNAKDQTVIGRGQPIHTGGFNNDFSYKNFDLNLFFQWSYGNDIYNANRMIFEGNMLAKLNLNQFADYADRWTPENPSNTLYRVNGQGPKVYSSRVIEDGSYLRLKTVSLGYNFDAKLLRKIKLKTLRLSASAQNLITWTNYSGVDPEVSVRNSALTPGFDYSAYPRGRTIVFGLSTSF
jgi:TonB-linked SusC/RagA family outer membrane protein